jgi:rhomboid protease GluP
MDSMVTNIDENVMKLLHYFITVRGYNPIVLHGAENEIWLENMDGDYRIVRIVSNYIHNNEQFKFDIFRTRQIVKKIKKQTCSFNMNTISFFINLGENVDITKFNDNNNVFINLKSFDDLKNNKDVMESFPDIMNISDYKEQGIELFLKLTSEINKKNEAENSMASDVFKIKVPYVTLGIILINFILYMLLTIFSKGNLDVTVLVKFGALYKPLVLKGDYYRLISAAFLHIGVVHLIVNSYSLYVIGRQLESFLGRFKYFFVYIVSALCGSLMSMTFSHGVSVGASGAIFGLLGSLLYFGYNYRVFLGNVLKSQIIPLIILNLGLGFIIKDIDNAAHIGGLIGGVFATMAVGLKYKSTKFEKFNGLIILCCYTLFLFYMAFFR